VLVTGLRGPKKARPLAPFSPRTAEPTGLGCLFLEFPAHGPAHSLNGFLLELEFFTGRTRPGKMRALAPFYRCAPLTGLGRGHFIGIPCRCPRSGPRPTHTPGRSLLEIGRNK